MKKWTAATAMSLMCFTGCIFAESTNLNLLLGTAFSQLSNQQYMSPVTGLVNSYASNESLQTRPFYGLGVEYDFDQINAQPITIGLGLGLYYIGLGNISGVETPGVNILPSPQDTLTYNLQAKSSTLLFEPKLIYTASYLQPYVLAGIGYARNTLSNFTENTVSGSLATPSTSPYPNHSQTEFAYEAGLGVQHIFWNNKNNQAIICHVEYRYFNLGQSSLGTAAEQTSNEQITVKNTTANVINFGITYRF